MTHRHETGTAPDYFLKQPSEISSSRLMSGGGESFLSLYPTICGFNILTSSVTLSFLILKLRHYSIKRLLQSRTRYLTIQNNRPSSQESILESTYYQDWIEFESRSAQREKKYQSKIKSKIVSDPG